jgi:hypothetical protein
LERLGRERERMLGEETRRLNVFTKNSVEGLGEKIGKLKEETFFKRTGDLAKDLAGLRAILKGTHGDHPIMHPFTLAYRITFGVSGISRLAELLRTRAGKKFMEAYQQEYAPLYEGNFAQFENALKAAAQNLEAAHSEAMRSADAAAAFPHKLAEYRMDLHEALEKKKTADTETFMRFYKKGWCSSKNPLRSRVLLGKHFFKPFLKKEQERVRKAEREAAHMRRRAA